MARAVLAGDLVHQCNRIPKPVPRLEHSHNPDDIASRLATPPGASYLKDWIYGGIDGAVTTFAIVAGSTGADLSAKVILILGIANLLADGFSMAAANYSGSKSENEAYARLRAIEENHIALAPEGEREEVRQIFRNKGFRGEDLETVVQLLTSKKETWIETMMQAEYGMSDGGRKPLKAALHTFAAFVACGSVPLLPFVLAFQASATTASALTAVAFFAIGSFRSRWSQRHWLSCGIETTAIGMLAAGIAYLAGHGLQSLLG
ncbi:VIT1/CCC1 transporter family protein [Roseibium salinum]|uniref:VIT1/CCC1 transporter family protein n=1 Tax=Roseibium salinum TaxID=1604349 RepID=A0ABT3R277_9HYPH|nr:VIT1/CCC1 transporter family protein [Roseibium sp. DSM 29163]MCX2723226.1 VIT1/CCC1 transporter family protein [Roseibium sp. DSM 29163]